MSEPFRHTFHVRWADLDVNGHMANHSYLAVATDIRFLFFESQGLSMSTFTRLRVGPIVHSDQLEYFRELRLLDRYDINLELLAATADGARFRLRNTFYRPDGRVAARLITGGTWMDLMRRKRIAPPPEIETALKQMPQAPEFEILEDES